jgi:hypothetical protein
MKNKLISCLVFLVLALTCLLGAVGDDLRLRPPPSPLRKARIEQIKPAIEVVCAQAITRAIERKPATSENISYYFREMGHIFVAMETNVNYSAIELTTQIDKIAIPLDPSDTYTYDVRTLIITLYRLSYEDRGRADNMPPVEWLNRVCLLFRNAINTGLKDAGREGL